MQMPEFRLPRITLPRTPLNKGMKKGRGAKPRPYLLRLAALVDGPRRGVLDVAWVLKVGRPAVVSAPAGVVADRTGEAKDSLTDLIALPRSVLDAGTVVLCTLVGSERRHRAGDHHCCHDKCHRDQQQYALHKRYLLNHATQRWAAPNVH